mmetsp:Transcript_4894/g.20020  ORF Transcript_4894/g.20020 Transcript_4894/m.20020 type:complete len:249 (+) Transcript_4894:1157-1903(+)
MWPFQPRSNSRNTRNRTTAAARSSSSSCLASIAASCAATPRRTPSESAASSSPTLTAMIASVSGGVVVAAAAASSIARRTGGVVQAADEVGRVAQERQRRGQAARRAEVFGDGDGELEVEHGVVPSRRHVDDVAGSGDRLEEHVVIFRALVEGEVPVDDRDGRRDVEPVGRRVCAGRRALREEPALAAGEQRVVRRRPVGIAVPRRPRAAAADDEPPPVGPPLAREQPEQVRLAAAHEPPNHVVVLCP